MENAGAPPSLKVTGISAGEAHTLALTGDGSMYSWGRGTFGRLGNGSEADQLVPTRVQFGSETKKIVGISAGAYHSLALADDGSVWSWGYNTYGQLGVGEEDSLVPRLIEAFEEITGSLTNESETESKPSLKVTSVRAGGMMSLAIDNLGALWMWGNCPPQTSSTEGEFSLVSSSTPTPVWNFHGLAVVKVACGNEHVVALVSSGETHEGGDLICYSWGNNNHGQLGLGDTVSRLQPEIVDITNVYEIACGAFHTSLLAHRKRAGKFLESMCWTFGLGENGQLGHGTTKSVSRPKAVEGLPDNTCLISVDCGLFHTSVVASNGEVWSWGMEKGLGLCPEASFAETDSGDALSPILILCNGPYGSKFPRPVQVACGAAHTVLLADGGYKLWAWGRGRSGVLGSGRTFDSFSPTVVLWPPLDADFKEEGSGATNSDEKTDTKTVASDPNEVEFLRSKLLVMERYASILHGSIFGKPFQEGDIPMSLQNSGTFDIAREWENMLESCDRGQLTRLEMFYRNMLGGVKDKLMKQRIKELIKECLGSSIAKY